jgi:NTP pyrophosphatase (non-canonical NTP hydrolase)
MTLQELLAFTALEESRLQDRYDRSADDAEKRAYGCAVKLMEEIGELSNEVLAFHGKQRQEKMVDHNAEDLALEVADVIICTLMLAQAMGADVEDGLRRKMAKINARYGL